LEVIIMDKGHITVRCLLHDLSYHESIIRLKNTYNSDILQESVKGFLILRNVRQRLKVRNGDIHPSIVRKAYELHISIKIIFRWNLNWPSRCSKPREYFFDTGGTEASDEYALILRQILIR